MKERNKTNLGTEATARCMSGSPQTVVMWHLSTPLYVPNLLW